jgi:nitrate reductase delta subunit
VTTALTRALASTGDLLTYPVDGYGRDLPAVAASVAGQDAEAAAALAAFAAYIRDTSIESLQEAFTQTFDLNPVCALEVGWQLFGEEYERGAFMVHMRQLLREHGVPERGELPDHLSSLLALLSRLDTDQARAFAADALQPAVGKMLAAIEKSESPFRPLMDAVGRMLAARVATGAEDVHA